MHIAFVLPSLAGGGAERVVLTLARGLIDRGHKVDLVLSSSTQILYSKEVPEEVRLFASRITSDKFTKENAADVLARLVRLRPRWRGNWLRLASALHWNPLGVPAASRLYQACAIASYMVDEKPDCILPVLQAPHIATLLACHLVKESPPIIPCFRNVVRFRHPGYKKRYRCLWESATHFTAVSHGVADDVAAEIGIPLEKITTIYNPVLTPDLHDKMKEPPDHPWLLDNGSPIVLAAGRLTEQKDHPTLLRAFSRLSSQRPCRLIILGTETSQSKLRRLVQTLKLEDRVSRSKLETLVQTLKLEDRVSFPGWTENPFAFMSRASLFVLSSRYEGLPGVLVQALACGCPCVSTDCPAGPAEILQDGKLGPLVPVGDEAALAEAMGQILDQPPDRQMLQQRATFFSVERAVDAYEQLILEVTR